ncbi:oligosaccharide flippase family protein [Desnuesiella massiliensis]|uniref:oligosaccharide flippase family protein n=1 Tax=Desnuesiella massiliensis TaxID=1650662 RepID=UPI0006E28757|nr:oligosaccharide flippase family protein [Desnuesiella massiliensis]
MSKSLFKNAFYKVLLNVFNLIIPIIIGPYVYRVLSKELIGRYNYGYTIFNYFFIFASFGIYGYALREISRVREDKKKLSSLFASFFVIGLISNVVMIAVYIAFDFIYFRNTPMFNVLLILTINMISNIFYIEWAIEAVENFDFITKKTIIIRIIYVVLIFTMVKTQKDFLNYVFLSTLYTFLNNIASFGYITKNIKFDFTDLKIKKHVKYMLMVLVMSNSNVLYTQLDKIMLGRFIGEASVANYTLSQSIMTIINTVILSVVFVTVPRLSNILSKEDKESYLELIHKSTKTLMAFLFPAALGIYVLANEIVVLYGGSEYIGTGGTLKIFSFYMIVIGLDSIMTNQILYVHRKEKYLLAVILGFGVLNLAIKFILVSLNLLNENTAVATTALCNYILVLVEYIYVRKNLKLKFKLLSFDNFKYLFISLSFLIIDMVLRAVVNKGALVTSALMVGACSLVYLLILIIIKDKVLIALVNKIKGRFA